MPTLKRDVIWYIALTGLRITNAPGSIPSTIKVEKGQRFQLDGDENIDLDYLLRSRAMALYTGSAVQEALRAKALVEMKKKRDNPLRKAKERARNG